jgi:hypothetical protein
MGLILSDSDWDDFIHDLAAAVLEAVPTGSSQAPAVARPPATNPLPPGASDADVDKLLDQWAAEAAASQTPQERVETIVASFLLARTRSIAQCPKCGCVFLLGRKPIAAGRKGQA